MALDVTLSRESLHWSSDAAAAFRHGVHDLEDHLVGLGVDRADLEVHVRSTAGEADIHAILTVGRLRVDANAEDIDPSLAIGRLFDQLLDGAGVERLADGPVSAAEGPWDETYERLVASSHHMVARAVDLGDLPAGSVDPSDLADDALVGAMEEATAERRPSFRELRSRVAALLSVRIDEIRGRAGDVELDGPAGAPRLETADDDVVFQYLQPDAGVTRNEDLLSGAEEIDDADRVAAVEPATEITATAPDEDPER